MNASASPTSLMPYSSTTASSLGGMSSPFMASLIVLTFYCVFEEFHDALPWKYILRNTH